MTKSVTNTSNESRMTLKRIWAFLIPIAIFVFLFGSWNNSRPDVFLSSLDSQFPVGEESHVIVQEIENLGFDYTLYEYSYDRFRVISGTPTVSPLLTFPSAPVELMDDCNESDCSALRSSQLEYVYVFGFLRFHHTYRYLWMFRENQLVGTSRNNGYWGFIL